MGKELTPAQWDAKWRREEDARTLARAAEIGSDPKRARAAQAEIKKQMAELDKQKQAMAKVVTPPKTASKGGKKK